MARRKVKIGRTIEITQQQHDALLAHVKERLDYSHLNRRSTLDRLAFIDRQLSGHIILDQDQKRAEHENQTGKSIKPVDFNLQLTAGQIDEAVTFLMEVLAPDSGIYSAVTTPDKQDIAKGLVTLLNKQAKDFKHYSNFALGCRNALAYNMGAWSVDWRQILGNRLGTGNNGDVEVQENQIIKQGNEVRALDIYNFLWDNSVHPTKLSMLGEWFSEIDVVTPFRLKKWWQDEYIWNAEEVLKAGKVIGNYDTRFYEPHPIITYDGIRAAGGQTNWKSVLTAGAGGSKDIGDRHEIIRYVGWLVPKEFGLAVKVDKLQIWEIIVLNCTYIVSAKLLDNAHEQLPVAVAMPIDEGHELQSKSIAETLLPLQRFASHEMNVRQRDIRKKLYGILVYDPQQIPLMEKFDLLGGKVPARPASHDRDLRKAVTRIDDPPTSNAAMENVEAAVNLMQRLLPTDIFRQVADLNRATTYQAAAVVQGGNRRNHKIARMIDEQALNSIKDMELQNVYQYQEKVTVHDPATGQEIEIDPVQIRTLALDWSIGLGLRGLDRLIVAELLKELLLGLIQNPESAAQIDIIRMMDYIADLVGDKTDFNQFRIKSALDKLSPQEKDQAFQLYRQALIQQSAATENGDERARTANDISTAS